MEILDPNTRSCTFLTLTKYVGEKNKVEQAICSLRKDEAFLDSTNCYVAAESWRLSCAPNPNGIVYRYIPKEYYITSEQTISSGADTGGTHHGNAQTDEKIDISDSLEFTGIMTSEVALQGRQQFNIIPKEPTHHNSVSVNLDTIVTSMMKDLNPHQVTKGSKITLENANNDTGWYIIKDDPLAKLQGPGFGPHGLSNIYAAYYNNIDLGGDTSQHDDVFQYIELSIDKKYVPGITKKDLQEYFSRGIALWRPSYAHTHDTGDPNATLAGKLPYFYIFGPLRMQTSIAAQSTNVAGPGDPPQWVPNRQLFCKTGYYSPGNTVYNQSVVNNKLVEEASTIVDVQDFVTEQTYEWHVKLTGFFSVTGAADTNATQADWFGWQANRQYRYYCYRNLQHDPDHNIYHLIKSAPQIQSQKVDDDGNVVNTKPGDSATSTAPILYHPMNYKRSVTRRATTDMPVATYTPNDFMQWWNSGFGSQEQPYIVCTSPNGGWRLVVLADNISSLTISKKMCDDMGLLNYMVTDGVESEQVAHKEKYPVVVAMSPDTDTNPWVWNWREDYSAPTSMLSRTETREISEFIIVDRSGVEGAKLQSSDVAPQYLKEITTGLFFRLVAFNEKSVIQTEVQSVIHESLLRIDSDGNEVYVFTNPGKGSYLDNDQSVSIGSFSIFESIRLIVPSGISFDPMISSHSDARILCELRLPFQNTAEIQQGFLKNEPVVTSTESAFYGDIIWNNPPSGLQYLPLTTQGGIYDFEIAAELIARDPTVPPQRVYLGYTDIFQVKLRFINRN